ncbi:hypothetical protein CDEST_15590 [Colletotrichum destructivum]|uniref:Uncharacterized protein n=1 Tax=Colletotrichum destructivum TaxID=34406 RepID=A0AAX4J596_9PEZI|nr:hypothetical protein CDEST_15590 [Colletotrichum destructivum]
MDRYPCINRYKHGVDCPIWVYVHGARCEDCVMVPQPIRPDYAVEEQSFATAEGREKSWGRKDVH